MRVCVRVCVRVSEGNVFVHGGCLTNSTPPPPVVPLHHKTHVGGHKLLYVQSVLLSQVMSD